MRRSAVTASGTPLFVGSGSARAGLNRRGLATRYSGPAELYRGPQRGHGRVQGSRPIPVTPALVIGPTEAIKTNFDRFIRKPTLA